MSPLVQADLSCRNTKDSVGTLYTRGNHLTLEYKTDAWGTNKNGFRAVITAFKLVSKDMVGEWRRLIVSALAWIPRITAAGCLP